MEPLELAQPGRLVWLALVPLLYLLSRPPRPQQEQKTAYLALWIAARDKLRRRPVRFRWWRFLLLVLAFGMVVMAHSGPRIAARPGATNLVILLDGSASMAAGQTASAATGRRPGTDRTSWRTAVDRVCDRLARIPQHVDVRLGLCRAEVEVCRGPRAELITRLRRETPSGVGRVDLASLAERLQDQATAVWTVTDGLGPTQPPTVGALTMVGRSRDNVAITACSVRDQWPLPAVQVAVTVHNHGAARRLRLTLDGGIEPIKNRYLDLGERQAADVEFQLVRTTGGALTVRLQAAPPQAGAGAGAGAGAKGIALDDFAADDLVVVELPAPPRPTVAVRGEPDSSPALWAAARALADEFGGRVVDGVASTAGFLLTDGGRLLDLPPGIRMLSFGTVLSRDPGRVPGASAGTGTGTGIGTEAPPRLVEWHRTDPITVGLDLSELRIQRALPWRAEAVASPPAGQVLMRGEHGPLAVVRDAAAASSVHVAFRLDDSNFYKLAAFPQFVRRSFARTYGSTVRPRFTGQPLLDVAESDLVRGVGPAARAATLDRPLPAFADPETPLAVSLLILALACLAIRAYV